MRNPPKSPWPFAYGLFAYASFGVSLLVLVGFLFNADALPVTVDRGPETRPWVAVTINLLLIALFGLQHSVMARPGFKRVFTRLVPTELERSTYVLLSNIAVVGLCLLWRPLPEIIWTVETGVLQAIAWGGFTLAIVVLFAASFQIDHLELFGLRQSWNAMCGKKSEPPAFSVRGMYRWVRHPIYVGWLLLFWVSPTMTAGHLLLAVSMTAYVLIAMVYEERDLLKSIGRQYADYRQRVPALLPRLRPTASRRGSRRLSGLILLFATGAATSPSLDAAPTGGDRAGAALQELTIHHGGHERHIKLYIPSVNIAPQRIVVMLHGAGGNADRIRRFTGFGFERLADNAGWVIAYPEGIAGTWNDCRSQAPYPARQLGIDDVGFLAELVGNLSERFGVPTDDAFVTGFSNGGQMALRLAIERPHAIGSFGVAAAQLPDAADSVCATSAPSLHSLWIHSSEDPFLPYDGGASFGPTGDELGVVRSVDATRQWALEGLSTASALPPWRLPEVDGDTATRIEGYAWRSVSGLLLQQYILRGSGHVLPLRDGDFPAIVGRSAGDADFAAIVLEFLEATDCVSAELCHRQFTLLSE